LGSTVAEDHASTTFITEASQLAKVPGCLNVGKNVCLEDGGRAFQPFKAYWLRDASTSLTFKNYTFCPYLIYVFCISLRTNSNLCNLHHKIIGFCTLVENVYCAVLSL
jgi:hypothetical protein